MLETVAEVQPLREWSAGVAKSRDAVVPDFDPADAGVAARVLFLLEAPGPMATAESSRTGSGFISCDNDDATAETTWKAREAAGLHAGAMHWNVVPWFLGPTSIKPNAAELAQGCRALRDLLGLLPDLQAVVLAGNFAQEGWARHVAPMVGDRYAVLRTWHPSPRNMNKPAMRDKFYADVARAAGYAPGQRAVPPQP